MSPNSTPNNKPTVKRNYKHYSSPREIDQFIEEYYYHGNGKTTTSRGSDSSASASFKNMKSRRASPSSAAAATPHKTNSSITTSAKKPFLVRQSHSEHMSSAFAHATSTNNSSKKRRSDYRPLYSNGMSSYSQSSLSSSSSGTVSNRGKRKHQSHAAAAAQSSPSSPSQPQLMMTASGMTSPTITRTVYLSQKDLGLTDASLSSSKGSQNPLLRKAAANASTTVPTLNARKRNLSTMKVSQMQQDTEEPHSSHVDHFMQQLNLKTAKSYLLPKYHPLWKELSGEDKSPSFAESSLREKWSHLAPFFRKRLGRESFSSSFNSSSQRNKKLLKSLPTSTSSIDSRSTNASRVPELNFDPTLWIQHVKISLMQQMSQSGGGDSNKSSRAHSKKTSEYENAFEALFELAHDDFFVTHEEDTNRIAELKQKISAMRMSQKMASHVLLLLTELSEFCSVVEEHNSLLNEEYQFWDIQLQEQEELHEKLLKEKQKSNRFMQQEDDTAQSLLEEIEDLEKEQQILEELWQQRKSAI